MNSTVEDAIAEGLAELERVIDAPSPPHGYGADLRCTSDLRPDMAEVDGNSTLALAEAIVRRLTCPRGGLPDDPDYGIDLRSYLNRPTTADGIRALSGSVRSEVEKDDRVRAASVRLEPTPDGSRLTVRLIVVAADPQLGQFSLTLAATSAEVLIEELAA